MTTKTPATKTEEQSIKDLMREAISILEEIVAQGVLLGSDESQSPHTLGRIQTLFERCEQHPDAGSTLPRWAQEWARARF